MKIFNFSPEIDKFFYHKFNYSEQLNASKDLQKVEEEFFIHFYWQEFSIEFNEKTAFSIRSAIATQDLNKCKIILWSNKDLSKNVHLKPLLPFIKHKVWDMEKEMKKFDINLNLKNDIGWLTSDIFRILCLGLYGGVYADLDIVFFKDISPLLNYEFTYYWPDIDSQNNAILRIEKDSNLFKTILDYVKSKKIFSPNSFNLGRELFKDIRKEYKQYSILPASWFDIDLDFYMEDKMIKTNTKNSYPNMNLIKNVNLPDGIFTWHWNNKWKVIPQIGSKYHQCYIYINNLCKEKQIKLYQNEHKFCLDSYNIPRISIIKR